MCLCVVSRELFFALSSEKLAVAVSWNTFIVYFAVLREAELDVVAVVLLHRVGDLVLGRELRLLPLHRLEASSRTCAR